MKSHRNPKVFCVGGALHLNLMRECGVKKFFSLWHVLCFGKLVRLTRWKIFGILHIVLREIRKMGAEKHGYLGF